MLAQALIAASAFVVLTLGLIHLLYTFTTNKFSPRDPDLEARLKIVSPVLTSQLTMWRAWIGFNASHSLGAILFGLVYGYLALAHFSLLVMPGFLSVLGLICLLSYLVLAKLYWFSSPFRGVALALALYVAGLILGRGW
ncbi:MAG TPA: hypothetical protein VNM67_01045 [Thermoanaerobaculia bacterium]|jgi:hypothetical protein|nr:hypothetical protein [Thermoanaerobaculia bacterium]